MKRPIIIILISYIIGILGGLYTNSIAFFCFTIILAMCLWGIRKINNKYFRFLRRFLKRYTELLILISMTFGFLYTNILEQKYDTIYEAKGEIEEHCIVIAEKEPKEYKDLYKVKIVNSKNSARNGTKLYIRVNKKANIEVGDMLLINGTYLEPDVARNERGFNYKEYLKTLEIYGTVEINHYKVIKKGRINKLIL